MRDHFERFRVVLLGLLLQVVAKQYIGVHIINPGFVVEFIHERNGLLRIPESLGIVGRDVIHY